MKALISLFFMVFTLSIAQPDNPLYITYQTTAAMHDEASEFIETLEAQLEDMGYTVEFVTSTGDTVIAHLSFAHNRVRITPNATLLKSVSPILKDNRPLSLTLAQTDIAVELLYYSIGDCEHKQSLRFYAANCALVNGDYEAAIALYDPQRDVTNLAWAYVHSGQQEEAFDILTEALESATDETTQIDLLRSRARLYALTFDYDAAITDMDAAIALDPENPALYVQRGQTVILLYEWDRVLENYDTAIDLNPDYAEAYFYRGVLYYSVLDREPALADFETYLELVPDGDLSDQATAYAESIRIELENLSD